MNKITRRWLSNSLGVIVVILVALEIAISVAVTNYYYDGVERILLSQSETISGLLSKYSTEQRGDYEKYFRSIVSSFEKKNVMELMPIYC